MLKIPTVVEEITKMLSNNKYFVTQNNYTHQNLQQKNHTKNLSKHVTKKIVWLKKIYRQKIVFDGAKVVTKKCFDKENCHHKTIFLWQKKGVW